MRKLLLLRGLPASGKSTFIEQHNLTSYTLSADVIRTVFSGPILLSDGSQRIPGDYDRVVWKMLFERLEDRMSWGEFLIVDATHSHPRSFANYQELTNRFRYQVICIDFSDVPLEECLRRNAARPNYKVVPHLEM